MSDIFISYSTEDKEYTARLAIALESQGWSVWWDRSIPIGKSYEIVIEEALDKAKCVIVLWSKASVKSQWVRAETAEAQQQDKIFPINIDGSKPPLVYRALQMADFINWTDDLNAVEFKNLVSDVQIFIKKLHVQAEAINTFEEMKNSSHKKPDIGRGRATVAVKVDDKKSNVTVKNHSNNGLSTEKTKQYQNDNFKRKGFVLFIIVFLLLIGAIALQKKKVKVATLEPATKQSKKICYSFDFVTQVGSDECL